MNFILLGLCASLVFAKDPMEDPNLFQGDMILTKEQREAYLNGEANSAVPLAAVKTGLWPRKIPYTIDDKLAKHPKAVEAIKAAISDYHKLTCLRFIKRTDEKGYIDFYMGGGCHSPVGYYGSRNGISLADGCWHKGIVMHEMAHSLGFYHEQSRPDRDHYVIIHWENIKQNMQYNFHKQKASNIDSMSVPYDYKSIMHYGRTAFGRGKLTIETRDPAMQRVIGRRSGFSDLDVLQMNLLYQCPGFTKPPKESLPPITKIVSTTAPFTGDCKDKSRSCSFYKRKGYCTKSIWNEYMKSNCAVTCGFCKSDDIVFGNGNADACMDTIHYCDFYIKKGYCNHPKFGDYMKRNCPLSCKFCKPGVETQPPLVTGPPVTAPFTTPDCMDTIHYCDFYKKKGHCTDERFIDYMTRNCPKSCGICKPDADKASAFADACMDTIHFCDFYIKKGYCNHPKFGDYMKRNCPLSCKFCKPGVETQPPLVTRPPVTVPFTTPDCMDTIHYCDFYKKKGHCTDERFIDYMTRNCPKTCGICMPDASENNAFADACMDTIHYCDFYIKKGYCNHPKFGDYMKRNCPLSCKFCKPGVETQPPLVTRQPVTVPFTTPDCMDTIHYCDWYKKKGHCTDERFIDYMTRNCPKTCGICMPAASGNNAFADACMDTIHFCDFYIKKGYCTHPKFGDYMKRNCPLSCKFCKPGVETQPPLVTKAPVTVPFTTPDCMDTIHYCDWYKKKGHCTDERFIDYMTRNCPKTCGICKPAASRNNAFADACMDTIHYCDFYIKKGYCNHPKFGDYMKRNCPLSCKFCKPGVETQPPLVTRPPVTVPFTTPDCMDTIHYCDWYKKKGHCTDERFIDYMTRNCPKTCGVCKPAASGNNAFADACMDTIHFCDFYIKKGYCTHPKFGDYMKRNCPLSCKFCKPGVETQPPLVTRPPVTVPFTTPDCMDTIHYCDWYKKKGHCTDERFIDYMTRNCPKTCGICMPAASGNNAFADACIDTIHYCDFYIKKGYCTHPKFGDYMKRNCPLSCKFCKPGVETQPPLVTRPPVTVPFTTPDCMDTIHYCDWYKKKGHCTDERFIDYMTRNCPKTCGVCKPDAAEENGYADACMDTIHYCDFYVKKGYCSRPKDGIIGDYMQRNCPLSCKFCTTGVATQPPLVTRPPVTVPFTTPECMDTIHYCDWYQNKGYCTDQRFIGYMMDNCPKTCQFCTQRSPSKDGVSADACMDTIHYCDFYVKKGYCSRPKDGIIGDYMQRNCPLSCKFCKKGVATQPPLVTRAPVTVPFTTPDCMDTIHYCDWYQNKGYCTDQRFIGYMMDNCPKTCQFCTQKPPSQDIVFADACMDTIHYCDFYVKKGYCSRPKDGIIGDYMQRNCPLSCKFCKKGVATQPPLVTRAPVTVPFTTPDCMDTIHFCDWYQNKGYCTDQRFIEYMTNNCPKTCGICIPKVPSQDIVYADACIDTLPYCDFYVKKGYCTNPKFADYMRRNCPLSCKHCRKGEATQPPIVTRPPRTVPFTTPDCMDTTSYCELYMKKNYCTELFVDYMKRNCPKTCGFCTTGSGGQATTTPTGVVTNPPTAAPTGSCGLPEVFQSRVIAGENARKGAWPWQILMLFMNSPMCGGALIAPNWVVTAAHCVHRRNAFRFKIRVGEHQFTTSSEGRHKDIQVQKIIVHPSYSKKTLDNDIALMKLARPATFGKYVKPVCLPDYKQDVPVGTQCFITGWGKIKHPGRMHHTLQQGKMPVVTNSDCSKLNTKNLGISITKNMVCAGHGGKTRVSGCHGDSGGPFVCQTGPNGSWVLHGAVSWGSGRCDAKAGYTVFARISEYKQWIDRSMGRN